MADWKNLALPIERKTTLKKVAIQSWSGTTTNPPKPCISFSETSLPNPRDHTEMSQQFMPSLGHRSSRTEKKAKGETPVQKEEKVSGRAGADSSSSSYVFKFSEEVPELR